MPVIPPEILPALAKLGIVDPADCRWERREDWPIKYMRAHYFCPCGNRNHEQKVELNYATFYNRNVYIGQCQWCKKIYWRDAVRD